MTDIENDVVAAQLALAEQEAISVRHDPAIVVDAIRWLAILNDCI